MILAIPSKGRLKEQTEAFLADAGLTLDQPGGARSYVARIREMEAVEVRLLSASEIANGVISGALHVGITGEDLLRESTPDLDRLVHLVAPMGFGRARLVVAVPKSWIDVETMADIDDVGARMEARTGTRLRVATKYVRSTRTFFSARGVGHYRIVESAGATEGAPAAGAAELIVDITTSGATLEGNHLKILRDGLILDSQAHLAASLSANWTPGALEALKALLDSFGARRAGKELRVLRCAPSPRLEPLVDKFGAVLAQPGEIHCPARSAHALARSIAAAGYGAVTVGTTDVAFSAENPAFEAFQVALRLD